MSFLEYFNLTEKEQKIFKTVCSIYPLENSWDATFSVRDINNHGYEFTTNAFNNLVTKAIFNKDNNIYSFNKEKLMPYYQEYQKNLDTKIKKLKTEKETLLSKSNKKSVFIGILLLITSIIIPAITDSALGIILFIIAILFGFKKLFQPLTKKKRIRAINSSIEFYNKQKLNLFS